MARKGQSPKRQVLPDPVHSSEMLARFINRVMRGGKKSVAERMVYTALSMVEEKAGKPAIEVFDTAMANISPQVEVRPRRVGGQTYQVPIEVTPSRKRALAMRWLAASVQKKKSGRTAASRLAQELLDAFNKTGAAYKKREDTHKMAEANRAFAHYRW